MTAESAVPMRRLRRQRSATVTDSGWRTNPPCPANSRKSTWSDIQNWAIGRPSRLGAAPDPVRLSDTRAPGRTAALRHPARRTFRDHSTRSNGGNATGCVEHDAGAELVRRAEAPRTDHLMALGPGSCIGDFGLAKHHRCSAIRHRARRFVLIRSDPSGHRCSAITPGCGAELARRVEAACADELTDLSITSEG